MDYLFAFSKIASCWHDNKTYLSHILLVVCKSPPSTLSEFPIFHYFPGQNTSVTMTNQTFTDDDLPSDMQFNSAHVISIVGYGSLFVVSSIANLTVLRILIRRYRKTRSRVNLLLSHLAVADLLVSNIYLN